MSLLDWPLIKQIRTGADGTGPESMSARTRGLAARTAHSGVARSVCPYCGVGCGQRIYHEDGKLVAIDGDPEGPINQGTLCPKGAASHQLLTHERRLRKVLHREPGGTAWREMDLDEAMDRVADLAWQSRKNSWRESDEKGRHIGHTDGIAHLGGATLDNEENYLIKKLFTAGMGMVAVSNQARI